MVPHAQHGPLNSPGVPLCIRPYGALTLNQEAHAPPPPPPTQGANEGRHNLHGYLTGGIQSTPDQEAEVPMYIRGDLTHHLRQGSPQQRPNTRLSTCQGPGAEDPGTSQWG